MISPLLTPEANRPFLFSGGPVGCLLVHGFTGTPNEMRGLGRFLADQGFSVLGVRLFAHSIDPEDMKRATWRDWAASVEDGYWMLREIAPRQVVMGLSMGALLSLELASRLRVEGVVAMSALAHLPSDWRLRFTRQMAMLMPFVAKGPPDWVDPEVAARHAEYPKYPVRSLGELRKLVEVVREALPRITVPTLVIQSRGDGSVPAQDAEEIFQNLGSPKKQLMWIERSGHVVTEDAEHLSVWRACADWAHAVTENEAA